jgi:hypothetical protein
LQSTGLDPAGILRSIFLDTVEFHIAFLRTERSEGAAKVVDSIMVRLDSLFEWLSLSGIIVKISHFHCLSFENKPAARVGFADGNLVDNLPETIGKILFVWLDLWLNG